MSLKLIRKTENGDLLLEGLPVYVAGSVAAASDLPVSGEAMGEGYIVGKDKPHLAVWIGKWIFYGSDSKGNCDCPPVQLGSLDNPNSAAAIDAETINRTLLQTGFQAIPEQ